MSIRSPIIQPLQLDQFEVIRDVIERHRHAQYHKILNWLIAGFSVAIVVLLWVVFSHTDINSLPLLCILFLCIFLPSLFIWQIDQEYRRFFASILIPEFIKRFNLQKDVDLQYSILGGISQSQFQSCGLFSCPDEYTSNGLIEGKIGKTQFRCASIYAQEIRTYSKNRKQKIIIFSGLFFIADANKDFIGRTFVVPDNVESLLGNTGHSLQELFAPHRFGRCELVSLEDPDFERSFATYSSDQIEARYLLTPMLMQQISAVQKRWNCPLYIAFIYGKMFLAIGTRQNWFNSPSVMTSVNAEVIQSAHQNILMMLHLVDELGLNTRIWG